MVLAYLKAKKNQKSYLATFPTDIWSDRLPNFSLGWTEL